MISTQTVDLRTNDLALCIMWSKVLRFIGNGNKLNVEDCLTTTFGKRFYKPIRQYFLKILCCYRN